MGILTGLRELLKSPEVKYLESKGFYPNGYGFWIADEVYYDPEVGVYGLSDGYCKRTSLSDIKKRVERWEQTYRYTGSGDRSNVKS